MMTADRIHAWANLIVGFAIPRAWLRRLSKKDLETVRGYVEYVWLKANDNNPRKVERPRWFPKRYLWKEQSWA